jgi:hypothetical protein
MKEGFLKFDPLKSGRLLERSSLMAKSKSTYAGKTTSVSSISGGKYKCIFELDAEVEPISPADAKAVGIKFGSRKALDILQRDIRMIREDDTVEISGKKPLVLWAYPDGTCKLLPHTTEKEKTRRLEKRAAKKKGG